LGQALLGCGDACALLEVDASFGEEGALFRDGVSASLCNGALDVAASDVLASAFLCFIALAQSASESCASPAFASEILHWSLMVYVSRFIDFASISRCKKAD